MGKADRTVPANLQRFMATRANGHISEFGGGHLALICDPEPVVDIIQEAVDATSASS